MVKSWLVGRESGGGELASGELAGGSWLGRVGW